MHRVMMRGSSSPSLVDSSISLVLTGTAPGQGWGQAVRVLALPASRSVRRGAVAWGPWHSPAALLPARLVLRASQLLHNSAQHDLFSSPSSPLPLHKCGCGGAGGASQGVRGHLDRARGGQAHASPCSE